MNIDAELRKLLGETYGGPSLSYERGEFVLYRWTDAPLTLDALARGETLEDLIRAASRARNRND